jgi:hypothetical protein
LQRIIHDDAAFRGALPVGFHRDERTRAVVKDRFATLTRELTARMSRDELIDSAIDEAGENAALFRQPSLSGHLLDLDKVSELGVETQLFCQGSSGRAG